MNNLFSFLTPKHNDYGMVIVHNASKIVPEKLSDWISLPADCQSAASSDQVVPLSHVTALEPCLFPQITVVGRDMNTMTVSNNCPRRVK